MIVLHSLIFNILYVLWTWSVAFFSLPLLLTGSSKLPQVPMVWSRGLIWLLEEVCDIRYEVRGKEYILSSPALYACKHQSAWETFVLFQVIPNIRYVLKQELLRLPLVGRYMAQTGHVAIDRSGGMSAMKQLIQSSKATLGMGCSLVIFPEGTRIRPEEDVDYHPGVAAMYNQLGVPVVPVALNSGLFWGKNSFLKYPGTIVLEFLPPIAPGLDRREFMRLLKAQCDGKAAGLVAEARRN